MPDDEDWVDPSWLSEVETVVDEELKFKNLDVIRGWAVKLKFNKAGAKEPLHGSGFFVRVPQEESDKPYYDVIFTAAHNLTTIDGIRTTNLQVFYADPDVKQGNAITYSVKTHTVSDPKDVYWCPDYKSLDVPQSDYGFIRIPRAASNLRRGFGFSLPLAYQSYFQGRMYISGFQDETQPGYPILASGECRECYQNLVEYDIKTQPGLSGSGVWLVYKDGLIAVAIHNQGTQGSTDAGSNSRGARLTTEMFNQAFTWLTPKIMKKSVRLRAKDTRKPPRNQGLFLSFQSNSVLGGVRLGSGTVFDLMPAEVSPNTKMIPNTKDEEDDPREDSYALRIEGKEWVVFDHVVNGVLKTNDMTDRCLFRKRFEGGKKPESWRVRITTNKQGKDGDTVQLRMEDRLIKDYDKDLAESSEVTFVPYSSGNDLFITKFWFE